jgi:hypothetical protein
LSARRLRRPHPSVRLRWQPWSPSPQANRHAMHTVWVMVDAKRCNSTCPACLHGSRHRCPAPQQGSHLMAEPQTQHRQLSRTWGTAGPAQRDTAQRGAARSQHTSEQDPASCHLLTRVETCASAHQWRQQPLCPHPASCMALHGARMRHACPCTRHAWRACVMHVLHGAPARPPSPGSSHAQGHTHAPLSAHAL